MYGYTNGDMLLSALGSFWGQFYKNDMVRDYADGSGKQISNLYLRICEIILGSSLKDIPVFSSSSWELLVLKDSQKNTNVESFLKYGDTDLSYGADGLYYGGITYPLYSIYSVPFVDTGNFMVNRIYEPTFFLRKGTDYVIRNNTILFLADLFSGNIPIVYSYDADGNIIDREVYLWLPKVSFDESYLYKRYGYILGIPEHFDLSGEEYKNVLYSLLGLYTNGPKEKYVIGFMNAIFGIPISTESKETIKYIEDYIDGEIGIPNRRKIYTDIKTYDLEINEYIKNFNIHDDLTLFTPFYSNIELSDNLQNYSNADKITLPDYLLSGEYTSPLNILFSEISLPMSVGSEFSIGTENAPDDKKDLWDHIPLEIGEMFIISDDPVMFTSFDYVNEQIKYNISKIVLNDLYITGNKKKFIEILNSIVPAISILVIVSNLNMDQEQYSSDRIDDNDVSLGEGHFLQDGYNTFIDGHYTQTGIGEETIIGYFAIGDYTFLDEPKVISA